MIDVYKRHSSEVAARLTADRSLRKRALRLLRRVRPSLRRSIETGELRLDATSRRAIRAFAEALKVNASKELSADLDRFLKLE
jgi:hypothetical protein